MSSTTSDTARPEGLDRGEKPRPGLATRRLGYAVSVAVNAAMLYAVNRWPGWEKVPFLTEDTVRVIGLVDVSIAMSLLADLVYLLRDPRWLRALGDVVTTTVGLAALVRIWQVFPFDFADSTVDWTLVTRGVLALGILGSGLAIAAAVTSLLHAVAASSPGPTTREP